MFPPPCPPPLLCNLGKPVGGVVQIGMSGGKGAHRHAVAQCLQISVASDPGVQIRQCQTSLQKPHRHDKGQAEQRLDGRWGVRTAGRGREGRGCVPRSSRSVPATLPRSRTAQVVKRRVQPQLGPGFSTHPCSVSANPWPFGQGRGRSGRAAPPPSALLYLVDDSEHAPAPSTRPHPGMDAAKCFDRPVAQRVARGRAGIQRVFGHETGGAR